METVHEVTADGYYYCIFYSDNDYVQNDIHAVFNIHKPTYQYAKHSRACYNSTECTFPLAFWSDEIVIVEVPTRDGIEYEEEDVTFLVSSCHPRMSVCNISCCCIVPCIGVCIYVNACWVEQFTYRVYCGVVYQLNQFAGNQHSFVE